MTCSGSSVGSPLTKAFRWGRSMTIPSWHHWWCWGQQNWGCAWWNQSISFWGDLLVFSSPELLGWSHRPFIQEGRMACDGDVRTSVGGIVVGEMMALHSAHHFSCWIGSHGSHCNLSKLWGVLTHSPQRIEHYSLFAFMYSLSSRIHSLFRFLLQHAYALQLLANHMTEGATVLDVGSGSGYLTACMAIMVCRPDTVLSTKYYERTSFVLSRNVHT